MQQSIDLATGFSPGQILYIEHQGVRLYAEVIQVVRDRKLCWVRPLALVTPITDSNLRSAPIQGTVSHTGLEPVELYDLRQGADLVCPQSLLQIALDTEVIPVLTELDSLKPQSNASGLGENNLAHEQLREFIRHIWQTNPQIFNQEL